MSQALVLIGAGRSGTKFLRNTLASSRVCDAVPYDVNYIWRYGNEAVPHDILPAGQASPAIKTYIRNTLPKLAKSKANQEHQYLVEKTVSNCLRLPFINEVFPEAKYIHIIRDGREVVESAARMWKEPPQYAYLWQKLRYFPIRNIRYALWYARNVVEGALSNKRGQRVWGPRYPGMEEDAARLSVYEVCALQWQACVEAALEGFAGIPAERVFTLRYEDLVKDDKALSEVCDFLALPDAETVIKSYQASLRKDTRGKWQKALPEESIKKVLDLISPTLDKLDYS